MMEHKIPCEMIRDLLPLYVEQLTSRTTDELIREHLGVCDTCKEAYENMAEQLIQEKKQQQLENDQEIDYMKKIRKASHKKMIAACFSIFLLLAAVLFLEAYIVGYPSDYDVLYRNPGTEENRVDFGITFSDPSLSLKSYKINRDGELVLYGVRQLPWDNQVIFDVEFSLDEIPDSGLDVNGMTLYQDGTMISKLANELYDCRNPYVGDMPANGRIAGKIDLLQSYGSYSNQLQTSEEPYRWTFCFQEGISNSALFEDRMKTAACILIAMIDNLGEVSLEYTVELEEGFTQRNRLITADECSAYVGQNIKSFSDSPENVQHLLDLLGIE